ncbi:DUF6000 family protein [Streptomyces rubiginosohelvolus]|uniref:DUF6000 family protein n=1 Tax=Streptomyces rubiginosohelvolus TaxID=67362 RepID=UPI003F4D411A
MTDAVPAPRGSRLRPCGRELRDEDVRRSPALPRPERRAFLGPRWWQTTRFTRHLIADAAAINDEELEALLGYEWCSHLTAGWLIGVDRRDRFRVRIGDLLLASEVCYSGSAYCFALAHFGTHTDAAILTAYLDRYLPRTDFRSSDT